MAALALAQKNLGFPPAGPRLVQLLEFLLEKYEVVDPGTGTVPTVDNIVGDDEFKKLIVEMGKELLEEDKKKPKKKKVSKTVEERVGEYSEHKCQARLWKRLPGDMSYDNLQCSGNSLDGGCFCKRHQNQVDKNGGVWWLGKITEPRPEEPNGPPDSKNPRVHKWNTDSEGKEIVHEKKKKSPKKTSSKKKKVSPVDMDVAELEAKLAEMKLKKEQESKEEVEEVVEEESSPEPIADPETEPEPEPEPAPEPEKLEEQDLEEDNSEDEEEEEESFIMIEEDGVEYQVNKDDNTVIRIDDFTPVGTWDEENKCIVFEEEDDEE